MPVALNGKIRDVMFRAAQFAPITKLTQAQFTKQQTKPEFVGKVAKEIYNRRGGISGGAGFGQIYRATKETMARRKLGRALMKSGFAKAGSKIAAAGDASVVKPIKHERGLRASVSSAKSATPGRLIAEAGAKWFADSGKDKAQKQAIVDAALARGVSFVVADMETYVAGKLGKKAREVSA
jgi:hypothetical protein